MSVRHGGFGGVLHRERHQDRNRMVHCCGHLPGTGRRRKPGPPTLQYGGMACRLFGSRTQRHNHRVGGRVGQYRAQYHRDDDNDAAEWMHSLCGPEPDRHVQGLPMLPIAEQYGTIGPQGRTEAVVRAA
jgi:hypothetical protein